MNTGPVTIPVTVSTVSVDRVLWGNISGTAVAISQIGGPGVQSEDFTPLLLIGHKYLLFVRPLDRPGTSGEYAITGDQGAYELSGSTYKIISKVGPSLVGGATLPLSIPVNTAPTVVLAG